MDLILLKLEEELVSVIYFENFLVMEVEGEMLRLDSDKEASKEMIDLLERIVRGYYEFILRIMFLSDDEVRVILKEGYVSLL